MKVPRAVRLPFADSGCPPRIPSKAWSLFVIEFISWIDCTLVNKLKELKTREDDAIDDFDERFRLVQTLREMGNVTYREHAQVRQQPHERSCRTNTRNTISNGPFVTTPRANNSY